MPLFFACYQAASRLHEEPPQVGCCNAKSPHSEGFLQTAPPPNGRAARAIAMQLAGNVPHNASRCQSVHKHRPSVVDQQQQAFHAHSQPLSHPARVAADHVAPRHSLAVHFWKHADCLLDRGGVQGVHRRAWLMRSPMLGGSVQPEHRLTRSPAVSVAPACPVL